LEIKLMSVPGVELVGEHHRGRALTSEPPRRQVEKFEIGNCSQHVPANWTDRCLSGGTTGEPNLAPA
jgi:hypothetical protein